MKRIFCIWLAICFCISLTACGDTTPTEINEKNLKAVVICAGDAAQETSQAAVFAQELQTTAQMLGLQEEQVAVCGGIAANDKKAVEEAVRTYIKDGYSVIFGAEEGYAPIVKKLAAKFPRVTFAQIGDADETLPNFYAYRLKAYEGAYICGLVAAKFAENDTLGMLASDVNSAASRQMANAFLLGARVIRPTATLLVAQADTATYRVAVAALDERQCSGVFMPMDFKAAIDLASRSGLRVYTMFGKPDTETVLYSVTPRHRNQLVDTIQAVLSKTQPYYNNMQLGYADGFLQGTAGVEEGLSDVDMLPAAAQKVLVRKNWDVFSGVSLVWDGTVNAFAQTPTAVTDAQGNVRIPAGAGMPSAETLRNMDWWIEGISLQ